MGWFQEPPPGSEPMLNEQHRRPITTRFRSRGGRRSNSAPATSVPGQVGALRRPATATPRPPGPARSRLGPTPLLRSTPTPAGDVQTEPTARRPGTRGSRREPAGDDPARKNRAGQTTERTRRRSAPHPRRRPNDHTATRGAVSARRRCCAARRHQPATYRPNRPRDDTGPRIPARARRRRAGSEEPSRADHRTDTSALRAAPETATKRPHGHPRSRLGPTPLLRSTPTPAGDVQTEPTARRHRTEDPGASPPETSRPSSTSPGRRWCP